MPARSQPLPVPGWKLGVGPRYAWVTNLDSDRSNHEVGVGLRLRPLFVGLEAALDYHNEDLEDGVDLKSWPLSVSALVYPLGRYYALAGIVWAHTTVDFPHTLPFNDRTKTEHGYQLGVGVELPMPVVSVAADARWQFLDYEIDDIPETVGKIDADSFRITLSAFF